MNEVQQLTHLAHLSHLSHVIRTNIKLRTPQNITLQSIYPVCHTLRFMQSIFYTVLTNSEELVMIGNLTIQVFWDVLMCGRFRSAAMQHCITGCRLNKTTVETSDGDLTICQWGSSSNILNDYVASNLQVLLFDCSTLSRKALQSFETS